MNVANYLPSILTFDPPQASISMERALKNALYVLEQTCPVDDSPLQYQAQVAIDDLELMLKAVQS